MRSCYYLHVANEETEEEQSRNLPMVAPQKDTNSGEEIRNHSRICPSEDHWLALKSKGSGSLSLTRAHFILSDALALMGSFILRQKLLKEREDED